MRKTVRNNILNEYGTISGIITINQLIDYIVGEVKEELSSTQKAYEIVSSFVYKVQGSARIEDVNTQLHLDIPKGDYQTVAGYVLHLLGHLPREGEQVSAGGLKLIIREVAGTKITTIFIIRDIQSTETTDEAEEQESKGDKSK